MATLKQYFDTDFSRVSNAATMWYASCLGQIVEVTARTHFDFDAGVKFISFYLPQCGNARQVCLELLANSPKLLTETESKISVRAGFVREKADDIKELKFSGRVFIYSETPMDSDDMRLLEEYAGGVGLSCRIRSQDMVRNRSALEKPLAFISHDSQDKAEIARPLAVKLSQLMCPVWYDEFALKVGDSLRESIESGLKQCKKCVLVLSPYFLSNIGLQDRGLVKGKTVGIDATTLEANAAMRSIVRRDNGESYEEFLKGLAKESGIETPTREDLARLDRQRKKKASNQEWVNPHDPDARITKMKDGRTHLAHKAEHAVDLQTGAVLAVTLQEADQGDTTTIVETLAQAGENVAEVIAQEAEKAPDQKPQVHVNGIEEMVADKGYPSGAVLAEKKQRGQRDWEGKQEQQRAVYANRQRVNRAYGQRLLRKRGALIERSFAHGYDTGGMRRTHLRGHPNILKRQLIHIGAFNLSLIFRSLLGAGTPRELRNRLSSFIFALSWLPALPGS